MIGAIIGHSRLVGEFKLASKNAVDDSIALYWLAYDDFSCPSLQFKVMLSDAPAQPPGVAVRDNSLLFSLVRWLALARMHFIESLVLAVSVDAADHRTSPKCCPLPWRHPRSFNATKVLNRWVLAHL